jgi:hypothetical protein
VNLTRTQNKICVDALKTKPQQEDEIKPTNPNKNKETPTSRCSPTFSPVDGIVYSFRKRVLSDISDDEHSSEIQ